MLLWKAVFIPDGDSSVSGFIILTCFFSVPVSVTVFFIFVIIILIFVFRARLEGGDYATEEDTGAQDADDPDTAIVYNQTGLPNMTTQYEYFLWCLVAYMDT